MDYDPESLPDLLPIYYKRLFPYGPYYRWLNYGGVPKTYYSHREFSFTLKDDVYIRYLSFSDQQEFEKELQKRCPYKIDIGAVFSHRRQLTNCNHSITVQRYMQMMANLRQVRRQTLESEVSASGAVHQTAIDTGFIKPKDHKTVKATSFQAMEKELVFDIDMTDYDDVRSCCSGADICADCWPLMAVAVKIIHRALREDFGYEHILWVYSGRRGVHCWVCDEGARKLSQNARSAIADYLTLVKGGENQQKKVSLSSSYIHPSIQHALELISGNGWFEDYAIRKQDFLSNEEKRSKVLRLIPDDELCKSINEYWSRFDSEKLNSLNCWETIKKMHERHLKSESNKKDIKKTIRALDDIKLQYCYPRLDVNVSKGVNHLLKSPFCVHPKTGRVCVPMNPDKIDEFSPFTVPTVSQLCEELNERTSGDTQKKRTNEYRQSSLRDGLEVFEQFVRKLESTWKGQLILESEKSADF